MKIIDCHTHLGGPDFAADARRLAESVQKAGIEKAMVYADENGFFGCPSEQLLAILKPFKQFLLPVASVSPLPASRPSLAMVDRWLKGGDIFGLKFYTGYEHFFPAEQPVRPYLELLVKHDLPAIFHSGDTYSDFKTAKLKYAHSLHIDDLATEMPDLKIVIAHLGNPWAMDAAEVSYKNKNVFVDCSGLVCDSVKPEDEALLKRLFSDYTTFGGSIDKLLFGTDWDLCGQKEYVDFINQLPLDDDQKNKVFYENAQKLFKLKL